MKAMREAGATAAAAVSAYLAQIGSKGGQAGRGHAKRRGSAAHYRKLAAKRWAKKGGAR